MRKLLLSVVVGTVMMTGCGDDDKKSDQRRSYVIDKDQALRVTRLAMRTAALVGRHAAIPNGFAIGSTEAAPACPLSGVKGAIEITPSCTPDFAVEGAVDCTLVEEYSCPEASGAITNTVELRADGLDYSLSAADYQEGTEALGFIRYNGGVDVVTTPDGTSNYKDSFSAVARPVGDPIDTTVNSTSDVTVTTDAGNVVMNGLADLIISGTVDGQGKVDMVDLTFADPATCNVSPVSGTINLALVGIERAVIEFTCCGEAVLHHFEGGERANPEDFTADELSYGFAQSVSDIANFRNVQFNTVPSAAGLEGNTFCAPVIPGVVPLLAASVTLPTTTNFNGVANPMLECLNYPEGATSFVHFVWEDQTGEGTFSDPTEILVHFFRAGALGLDVPGDLGGKNVMVYSKYAPDLLAGPVALTSLTLDAEGQPTADNLEDFCDPRPPTAGGPLPNNALFCWSRIAFNESFDHLGLRITEPSNVGKATGSGNVLPPEDIGNPFWYVHVLE